MHNFLGSAELHNHPAVAIAGVRRIVLVFHRFDRCEGGFEAGWFDANIHTTGENEEESVANLKSLILDFFDSFSREPIEKLGPEPKRQLAVIKQFLKRTP